MAVADGVWGKVDATSPLKQWDSQERFHHHHIVSSQQLFSLNLSHFLRNTSSTETRINHAPQYVASQNQSFFFREKFSIIISQPKSGILLSTELFHSHGFIYIQIHRSCSSSRRSSSSDGAGGELTRFRKDELLIIHFHSSPGVDTRTELLPVIINEVEEREGVDLIYVGGVMSSPSWWWTSSSSRLSLTVQLLRRDETMMTTMLMMRESKVLWATHVWNQREICSFNSSMKFLCTLVNCIICVAWGYAVLIIERTHLWRQKENLCLD